MENERKTVDEFVEELESQGELTSEFIEKNENELRNWSIRHFYSFVVEYEDSDQSIDELARIFKIYQEKWNDRLD